MRVSVAIGGMTGELEFDSGQLVELKGGRRGRAMVDVGRRVGEVLADPSEFPPLRQAVVSGDHVAIAVDSDVPQVEAVLGALVEGLVDAGVVVRDISVVEVPWRAGESSSFSLDRLTPGIRLIRHDALDRGRLSYLASTRGGTRVYLNRALVDADFVVLVGRVDYHPNLGYRGTSSSVFPGLADEEAQRSFRKAIGAERGGGARQSAREEADEVAWLLGVQFALQVVVGEGDSIAGVLAGGYREVQHQAQRLLNRCWRLSAPRHVDLAIATLDRDAARQGFDDLGSALEAAAGLVRAGGRIVVLTELNRTPGRSLQMARQLQDPAKTLDQIQRQPVEDCISTCQIVQACRHARVYLLSKLEGEFVTGLGMTPISSLVDVQRLVSEASSCTLLPYADRVRVAVEENDVESDA